MLPACPTVSCNSWFMCALISLRTVLSVAKLSCLSTACCCTTSQSMVGSQCSTLHTGRFTSQLHLQSLPTAPCGGLNPNSYFYAYQYSNTQPEPR